MAVTVECACVESVGGITWRAFLGLEEAYPKRMILRNLSPTKALRRFRVGFGSTTQGTTPRNDPGIWIRWTVAGLRADCERRRIRYEETSVYENLRGVVVQYGRTSIISVKEALPEREKIAVLAHELGHIALDHTRDRPQYLLPSMGEDGTHPFEHDPEKEMQAQVWAAHLLVQPEVFDHLLSAAKASCKDNKRALHMALWQTASALNIPVSTVKLWTQTRDWTFPEPPRAWLERS